MPIIFLLLISLFLRVYVSTAIYSGDVNNHTGWGKSILSSGFYGAYERQYSGIMQPTYPPIALFAFTSSTGLYEITNKSIEILNKKMSVFPSKLVWLIEDQDVLPAFNKVIAIVTDIGVTLLIYMMLRHMMPHKKNIALFAAAVYGLNPAVWYVSSIWGQIESTPVFCVLLSYYLILKKKPYLSSISMVAALLSKQTSIIFLPIFFILFAKSFNKKTLLKSIAIQFCIFYISYIPFSGINPLASIFTYINRLQTGSGSVWITDHAFNAWALYTHLEKIPDSTKVFANVSASTIGIITFILLILIPLYRLIYQKISWQRIFLTSGYIPLVAFTVLTKMHERYSAPLLPFLVMYAAFNPAYWPIYIVVSIAHQVNLYHEWYFPRFLGIDSIVAQPWVVSVCVIVFMSVTALLGWRLWRKKV